jgi:hypothetical protein
MVWWDSPEGNLYMTSKSITNVYQEGQEVSVDGRKREIL